MISLPLNKLKLFAISRSIKDYKNKSKDYLTKILSKSKQEMTLFFKKNRRYQKRF